MGHGRVWRAPLALLAAVVIDEYGEYVPENEAIGSTWTKQATRDRERFADGRTLGAGRTILDVHLDADGP